MADHGTYIEPDPNWRGHPNNPDVCVHPKRDGQLIIHRDGRMRFMTLFETIKYHLIGTVPNP